MATGLVVSKVQGVTVVSVRVASLLDETTIDGVAKGLYELVDQQAVRKLVVDFRSVSHMASRMLGVLVNLSKKSREIKGHVVLCGIRPNIMEVFKITRLDKILAFAPSESAAVSKIEEM